VQFEQSVVKAAAVGSGQAVQAEVEVKGANPAHQRILNGVSLQVCTLLLQPDQSQLLSHSIYNQDYDLMGEAHRRAVFIYINCLLTCCPVCLERLAAFTRFVEKERPREAAPRGRGSSLELLPLLPGRWLRLAYCWEVLFLSLMRAAMAAS
jgi:hypothetical protein